MNAHEIIQQSFAIICYHLLSHLKCSVTGGCSGVIAKQPEKLFYK